MPAVNQESSEPVAASPTVGNIITQRKAMTEKEKRKKPLTFEEGLILAYDSRSPHYRMMGVQRVLRALSDGQAKGEAAREIIATLERIVIDDVCDGGKEERELLYRFGTIACGLGAVDVVRRADAVYERDKRPVEALAACIGAAKRGGRQAKKPKADRRRPSEMGEAEAAPIAA